MQSSTIADVELHMRFIFLDLHVRWAPKYNCVYIYIYIYLYTYIHIMYIYIYIILAQMVQGNTSCCIAITKLMPAALKRLTPISPRKELSNSLAAIFPLYSDTDSPVRSSFSDHTFFILLPSATRQFSPQFHHQRREQFTGSPPRTSPRACTASPGAKVFSTSELAATVFCSFTWSWPAMGNPGPKKASSPHGPQSVWKGEKKVSSFKSPQKPCAAEHLIDPSILCVYMYIYIYIFIYI